MSHNSKKAISILGERIATRQRGMTIRVFRVGRE
jgi:hypothetical protein